jgi:hypothetical protein
MNKKNVDKSTVRWVALDGSIFTEDHFEVTLPFKVVKLQLAVAFNVGREVARHIVDVHNAELTDKSRQTP